VELKTDFYTMDKTPNHFFETYSNAENGRRGGPWHSMELGVDYFVYYYINSQTAFWFYTKELTEYLDSTLEQYRTHAFRSPSSKGATVEGIIVPRNSIKHLVIQQDTWKEYINDSASETKTGYTSLLSDLEDT
jgi:hypothetical protein